MDMASSGYFSFNVAALASMTNQQLEVSNELHMAPLPPRTPPFHPVPRGMAPHIPQTPMLIVTTVLVVMVPAPPPSSS